jgi:hypothetical protein
VSLWLTNEALHHEGVWGRDVYIHIILTSALVGRELSACPYHITHGQQHQLPTAQKAGWPQNWPGRYEEGNIFYTTRTQNTTSQDNESEHEQ